MRIVNCHVPLRSNCVDVDFLRFGIDCTVLFGDVGPQQPCCTEFCNFQEIIGTYCKCELDPGGSLVCCKSGRDEHLHVFATHGHCKTQLLYNCSTCIVECVALYSCYPDSGIILDSFHAAFEGLQVVLAAIIAGCGKCP